MTGSVAAMPPSSPSHAKGFFSRMPILIGILILLSTLVFALDSRVTGLVGRQLGLLRPEIPAGALPREGDILRPKPYPVDDWVAGATGTIGLKFIVAGPGLADNFWLRFTEGADRVSASARIVCRDERGLPVGEPFEKPFKDDC